MMKQNNQKKENKLINIHDEIKKIETKLRLGNYGIPELKRYFNYCLEYTDDENVSKKDKNKVINTITKIKYIESTIKRIDKKIILKVLINANAKLENYDEILFDSVDFKINDYEFMLDYVNEECKNNNIYSLYIPIRNYSLFDEIKELNEKYDIKFRLNSHKSIYSIKHCIYLLKNDKLTILDEGSVIYTLKGLPIDEYNKLDDDIKNKLENYKYRLQTYIYNRLYNEITSETNMLDYYKEVILNERGEKRKPLYILNFTDQEKLFDIIKKRLGDDITKFKMDTSFNCLKSKLSPVISCNIDNKESLKNNIITLFDYYNINDLLKYDIDWYSLHEVFFSKLKEGSILYNLSIVKYLSLLNTKDQIINILNKYSEETKSIKFTSEGILIVYNNSADLFNYRGEIINTKSYYIPKFNNNPKWYSDNSNIYYKANNVKNIYTKDIAKFMNFKGFLDCDITIPDNIFIYTMNGLYKRVINNISTIQTFYINMNRLDIADYARKNLPINSITIK